MIRLIAAIDQRRGLAKLGELPWHLPDDLQRFKLLTLQHGAIVVMGRKTYESIGRQLPGRRNVVLSHRQLAGVETVDSLQAALAASSDVWVIGGESVFDQVINKADELELTIVEGDFGCDQFFPDYSDAFKLVRKSEVHRQNGQSFHYETWRRRKDT